MQLVGSQSRYEDPAITELLPISRFFKCRQIFTKADGLVLPHLTTVVGFGLGNEESSVQWNCRSYCSMYFPAPGALIIKDLLSKF